MSNEKQELFEKVNKDYQQLFEELKTKDEYSPEDYKNFNVKFDSLMIANVDNDPVKLIYKPAKLNDHEIDSLPQFDLRSHLSKLMSDYNKNSDITANFQHSVQNGEIEYIYADKIYDLINHSKIMYGPESEKHEEKCRKTLSNMIEGNAAEKSPNKELAELVKRCGGLDKVNFRIMEGNGVDGHASFNPKNGIVIDISKGAFDSSYEIALPMLLGHELGHILDYSNRPKEYFGSLKNAEEYFADNVGYQLVSNGNFTEKQKYKAMVTFAAITGKSSDNLCRGRVDVMNGYIEQQHKRYHAELVENLRGTGKYYSVPAKKETKNEHTKVKNILSMLRVKSNREN